MVGNSKNNLLDDKNKEKMINSFLKAKKPSKIMFEELINKITISEDKTVKIYFKVNLNGSDKLCQTTN